MLKGIFMVLLVTGGLMMAGCSTKKVNDTVDSVTDDVKNLVDRATEQH